MCLLVNQVMLKFIKVKNFPSSVVILLFIKDAKEWGDKFFW